MPGSARGIYEPEDFIAAARVVYRKALIRRFVLGGLAVAASLAVWARTGQATLLMVSAALLVAFAYDYFLGQPVRIRRRVRGTPGMGDAVEVSWNDEGMSGKDATSSATQGWAVYERAIELPGAFILVQRGGLYAVIPKRWIGAFEAEADLRATLGPLLASTKR